MLIGYARVSTQEQNLDLQLAALEAAGCSRIFKDQAGGSRADRPGLDAALAHARAGDSLVVWKLDRLGRSTAQLIALVLDLGCREIEFRSLTESIDTSTAAGRCMFTMMAAFAQMERELIVERTRAGLDAAKKLGRTGGRPRKMTDTKLSAARKLLESGTPPRDVAGNLGISVATLYRRLPANKG